MCPSNLLTPNGARDKQSLYEDNISITKNYVQNTVYESTVTNMATVPNTGNI